MKAPKGLYMEMLKKMTEIRYFEEKVVDQYARALPGPPISISEEAAAVGARMNLTDNDHITSTIGATAIVLQGGS
jgi:TPP-dependent pyruvate/acetoin dehydrogenase alpha subunit